MLRKCDVLIVGGGVIGMACAHELASRGAQVTVIEKGEVGHGCSYGNAGWITPCFAMPLPMPGMLMKAMSWLLDPTSPLYIKPEPRLSLVRWLFRFLWSMNNRHMQASVAALTEISKYSIDAYAKLHAENPGLIGFERKGLLMAAQSRAGLKAAIREMELVAPHGIPGRAMGGEETRAFEPALTGKLEGAVYFPQEAHAEPLAVVKLLRELAERKGAVILSGTEVFDFKLSGNKVEAARTTRGDLHADQFVLATGSWSAAIGETLDLRIPVLGGKGYALIVKPFAPAPTHPIMLLEKKIAVTPRAGTIRLAGTLELVDRDESITKRRVEAIVRGAREFMSVPEQPEVLELWRGLRPCTPDGVPIIGRSRRHPNLILATGHQMLGLQSAPGTGRLVADIALSKTPAFELAPFRAERF